MTRSEIKNRVQDLFKDIFDDINIIVEESTTAENIEEWDSLNHITLISSIEHEFGIKFTLTEMTAINDVGAMIDLIQSKLS